MSLIQSTAIPSSATGYEIDQSVKFDGTASLTRTPSSAGNRLKWSFSTWIKRSRLSNYQVIFSSKTNTTSLFFVPDNIIRFEQYNGAGGYNFRINFYPTMRDNSAWYHMLWVYDSAQSTATNRIKFYLNGVEQSREYTYNELTQNFQSEINNTEQHWLGVLGSWYYDGYMAETHFIDGLAKAPTDFGEFGDYGEFKPIEYDGSYGNQGWYLNYATASDMGDDKSGNTNDWTESNIVSTDQMLDTPTNNFCTWNRISNRGIATLSEGNLSYNPNGTATADYPLGLDGSLAVSSGKWYFETCRKSAGSSYHTGIAGYVGSTFKSYKLYAGTYYYGDSNITLDFGAGSNNDIIGCAFDLDNNKIWFAKNGTWYNSGNPATNTNGISLTANLENVSLFTYAPNASYSGTDIQNCGQDSSFAGNKTAQGNQDGNGIGDFYYTPPSGFLALCTSNLSDPAVIPSEHFNTVLYSGSGQSGQAITGVGFRPDMVWQKDRSSAYNHAIHDVIRGTGTSTHLASNTTSVEGEFPTYHNFASFDSDGFTIGATSNPTSMQNHTGDNYVAWNWKANGSGSSNSNGSITSTVSANTDAGFSIVGYTGNSSTNQTVGHGLSKTPDIVIIKNRDNGSAYWSVINPRRVSASDPNILYLNDTMAEADSTNIMGNNLPTATTVGVDDYDGTNKNGDDFIMYCWHSVDSFSKMGIYTGNGNVDGTFVYTGFRPAYVMIKGANITSHWQIHDTARNPNNVMGNQLHANTNDADASASAYYIDFLSNGFKLRMTHAGQNGNGQFYIYMAFAETPFKYSNAR